MDIAGVGPAVVNLLVDKGLIKDAAGLYDLTAKDLVGLERFGAKSAENLLAAVERSKENPPERLLLPSASVMSARKWPAGWSGISGIWTGSLPPARKS